MDRRFAQIWKGFYGTKKGRIMTIMERRDRYDYHSLFHFTSIQFISGSEAWLEQDITNEEVKVVIEKIESHDVMPPVLVLQALAGNESLELSVVKDYIVRRIQAETSQIEEDIESINRHQKETIRIKSEIESHKTQPRIFQLSKCSGYDLRLARS